MDPHKLGGIEGLKISGFSECIGRKEGPGAQRVYLSFELAHLSTILHEMGHVVGLLHEVDRADSEDYVQDFKGCPRRLDGIPVGEFDCNSIMHYGFIKLKSSQKGISAKRGSALSQGDLRTIMTLYDGRCLHDMPGQKVVDWYRCEACLGARDFAACSACFLRCHATCEGARWIANSQMYSTLLHKLTHLGREAKDKEIISHVKPRLTGLLEQVQSNK